LVRIHTLYPWIKRLQTGPDFAFPDHTFETEAKEKQKMMDRAVHPHTRAILNAWRRLSSDEGAPGIDPRVEDFPNLLGSLFVLKRTEDGIWLFANAGKDLNIHMGRELVDHDFLSLWRGRDLSLVSAQLDAVRFGSAPGILRGRGETLTGQKVELEIALAPLRSKSSGSDRILGLYQMLGGEGLLCGRPIWRHGISAIYPPDTRVEERHLRLVASNE
tara:strand:+ start:8234 stop:8884 length:651 start_codon:yes stop_codon:yes gene_type:complete